MLKQHRQNDKLYIRALIPEDHKENQLFFR